MYNPNINPNPNQNPNFISAVEKVHDGSLFAW